MLGGLWLCFGLLAIPSYEVSAVLGGFTALFVVTLPLLGVYLGSRPHGFDLKSFTATRPLPDSDLAAAILRCAVASVGSAAVIWLVGSLAAMAIWVPEKWQALCSSWKEGFVGGFWEIGCGTSLLVLVCWTFVGLGASLAMCRRWLVCWGGVGLGAFLFSFLYIADRVPRFLAEMLIVVLALACLCCTIAAFIAARRRRLLSGRAVFACLAGYLILLVYLYVACPAVAESALTHALRIGCAAGPFAPFAAAPLALSWNRHR